MRWMLGLFLVIFSMNRGWAQTSETDDRAFFLKYLIQLADPVLVNLSQGTLKKNMPLRLAPKAYPDREKVAHLEAFGRLVGGMAPWLELGPDATPEGKLREKYIELTLRCFDHATNPASPDYLNFNEGSQPLVDAAFLAQALLRAPNQLWGRMPKPTQQRVIAALKLTRSIKPYENNWLLFSAMIETALIKLDGSGDRNQIDYALQKHEEWYLGDGVYGDGPEFHFDYYNSFVIHPMLVDIATHVLSTEELATYLKRAQRYAAIQERLISPEGTYPVVGRSMTYRYGAFQALAQIALMEKLPSGVTPAQVRSALKAVVNRHHEQNLFDSNGWLQLGFAGHQPELAESYITTGSLYLCAQVYLILGLPSSSPFWKDPAEPWTQKKIWSNHSGLLDRALSTH